MNFLALYAILKVYVLLFFSLKTPTDNKFSILSLAVPGEAAGFGEQRVEEPDVILALDLTLERSAQAQRQQVVNEVVRT